MTTDAVEEAPGHRIDPRGHCRCGWESRDAAFHWSGELAALGLPARTTPGSPST